MMRAGRPGRRWPVVQDFTSRAPTSWRGRGGAPRRARGACRAPSRRRTRHGRAAEGEVGDGREAVLVLAQRRAAGGRCGRRTAARGSSARTHQQCTRRPPGRTSTRARLPHEPDAERARAPARARCGRAARAPRGRRGRRAGRAPCARPAASRRAARREHVRAALGVELRDRPGVHERDRRDRREHAARSPTSTAAVTTNGHVCAAVLSVHSRPRTRSAALVDARAPGDGGGLGERRRPAASGHPPAIGRRRITSSASAGSSVTWRALALALGDDGVVAGLELLAERGRGGLDGGVVGGRPLRQRRVTGAVHADESCHGGPFPSKTTAVPSFRCYASRRGRTAPGPAAASRRRRASGAAPARAAAG